MENTVYVDFAGLSVQVLYDKLYCIHLLSTLLKETCTPEHSCNYQFGQSWPNHADISQTFS